MCGYVACATLPGLVLCRNVGQVILQVTHGQKKAKGSVVRGTVLIAQVNDCVSLGREYSRDALPTREWPSVDAGKITLRRVHKVYITLDSMMHERFVVVVEAGVFTA